MPLAHRTPMTIAQAFAAGWQHMDPDTRRAGYVDGLHGAPRRAPPGSDVLAYAYGYREGELARPYRGDRARAGDQS